MTSLKKDVNTETFVCYTFPSRIVVESKLIPGQVLEVDRKTRKITLCQKQDINFEDKNYLVRPFSSFLGVAIIEDIGFLVFCQECSVVNRSSRIRINEITSMFFVCFLREVDLLETGKKAEVSKKIQQLGELMKKGFYFSSDYNITQSYEYQKSSYVEEFTWNKTYLKELRRHVTNKDWITPVIQGYVGTFITYIQDVKISYTLISRRSCIKGGTRYFDRGVNEEGFVANFVESEQIVVVGNYVTSHIQIRGSVPIFFQQTGLTTKIKIRRSNELSREAFKRHIDYCKRRYGKLFVVNLLDTQKGGENRILKEFQQHVQQVEQPDLKYYYFNFHQKCPNNSFENVNATIEDLRATRRNLGYFIQDTTNGAVLSRQMGVLRTNCLDCLDRTNVLISKMAGDTLEDILRDVGLDFEDLSKTKFIEQMDNNSNESHLVRDFKTVWADNGDQISYHYTGTGSTHSDFTREGKRGFTGIFKHKVKSVTRFYNQNFWDFQKMKSVDLLLESKDSFLENEQVPNMLREHQADYCTYNDMTVELLAWKISGIGVPEEKLPLRGSDIMIFGLQEVQQSTGMFSASSNNHSKWMQFLSVCVNSQSSQRYIQLARCFENNNLCMAFLREDLKGSVTDIEECNVKFNYLSNKSCSLVRFQLDDNSFAFGSCQLDYGKEGSNNRVKNIKDIFKNAFQDESLGKRKSATVDSHDYQFLFGNLSLAINLDDAVLKDKVKQLITLKTEARTSTSIENTLSTQNEQLITRCKELFEFDQFESLRQNSEVLSCFVEESVGFLPTYKYHKNRFQLDESKSPSWADRIIYSSDREVECLWYCTLDIFKSDHLPLLGQFRVRVEKEDPVKKDLVYQQILEELNISRSEEGNNETEYESL